MKRTFTEHQSELRAILQGVLRQKHPTIYLVEGPESKGGMYPTTRASFYARHKGGLRKLWDPDNMRECRRDGNLYWHHNGWGTSHKFVLANDVGEAAGIRNLGSRVTVRWL